MSMVAPYQIAIVQDEIVVRINRSFFQADELTELLDYLRLKALRRQSRLTDAEIAELADEINQSGWERIKTQFLDGV
ncbi:MAG: hypothetical protein KF832_29085 [Caldilineaceae bacterium]|nr:hypothetical protein [Caldilineaceae bacterium]